MYKRQVHDQGTAEDVVQDAFIATHRNYDRIRDTGAAVAYLRRAVVNGARSVQRHDVVVRREAIAEAGRADAADRATAASAEAQALRHLGDGAMLAALRPVSYTHLDVYKRQALPRAISPCETGPSTRRNARVTGAAARAARS